VFVIRHLFLRDRGLSRGLLPFSPWWWW